jgi:hypothetical protein
MDIAAVLPAGQLQFIQIKLIIRLLGEYRSTIIPTQDDMLRLAGDDKSWQARQYDLLFGKGKLYCGLPHNQSSLTPLILDIDSPLIPVIALSANAMPRAIEKGLAAGFFRYLTKPIKVNEFMETLDLAIKFGKTKTATIVKEEQV